MVEGLIEAAKQFVAEAHDEAFARQAQQVADAFDANLMQQSDDGRRKAQCRNGKWHASLPDMIIIQDCQGMRTEAGEGPGGADGGGRWQGRHEGPIRWRAAGGDRRGRCSPPTSV